VCHASARNSTWLSFSTARQRQSPTPSGTIDRRPLLLGEDPPQLTLQVGSHNAAFLNVIRNLGDANIQSRHSRRVTCHIAQL
jgi:hypothetical protein